MPHGEMPGPLAALVVVSDLAAGRSPFALGRAGLVRTLRGTPDAPVREGRTAGFGALSGWRKAEVERLADALVEHGLLRRDSEDEYRRLYLTDEGREAVARGECDIEWRASPPTPSSLEEGRKRGTSARGDAALLSALKEWRRTVASESAVPPYVVFADKTLLGIAMRRPVNEFELQEVVGIGPAKAAKYGEAVLEIIREHIGS